MATSEAEKSRFVMVALGGEIVRSKCSSRRVVVVPAPRTPYHYSAAALQTGKLSATPMRTNSDEKSRTLGRLRYVVLFVMPVGMARTGL